MKNVLWTKKNKRKLEYQKKLFIYLSPRPIENAFGICKITFS